MFKEYFLVCRPSLLALGLMASIGLINWSGQLWTQKTPLIVILVFSVNLAWTLYNELMDRKLDRVNKPEKPLPSGEVSGIRVYQMMVILLGISLFSNLFLVLFFNPIYIVGFFGHVTAFIYNIGRKDLFGNICMSTTYGLACFVSLYPNYLLFSLAFFFFTFGHNIIQQFMDLPAEKAVGIVTVPMQLSDFATLLLTELLLVSSLTQFLWLYLQSFYIPLLIFIFANVGTAFSAYSLMKQKHEAIGKFTLKLERALLLVGFFAMLLF